MPAAWCEPDQESRMVLKIERFQPEGMNIRMSGGKPSYSHVVTVSGSGKIVYTAGHWPATSTGTASAKATCGRRWNREIPEPRPVFKGGWRHLCRCSQYQ